MLQVWGAEEGSLIAIFRLPGMGDNVQQSDMVYYCTFHSPRYVYPQVLPTGAYLLRIRADGFKEIELKGLLTDGAIIFVKQKIDGVISKSAEFTIRAGTTTTGGALILRTGSGTSASGNLQLQNGNGSNRVTIGFDPDVESPVIEQEKEVKALSVLNRQIIKVKSGVDPPDLVPGQVVIKYAEEKDRV